jgi:uncharacterized protein involved in exopolysaccharide biosynthesis
MRELQKVLQAEEKLRHAQNESANAKQQLSALNKETASMRPRLATLDVLQPKLERMQVQVSNLIFYHFVVIWTQLCPPVWRNN